MGAVDDLSPPLRELSLLSWGWVRVVLRLPRRAERFADYIRDQVEERWIEWGLLDADDMQDCWRSRVSKEFFDTSSESFILVFRRSSLRFTTYSLL